MRRATVAVLVGTIAIGAGCPSLTQFACEDADDCDRGGEGMCIAGDCAYTGTTDPTTGLGTSTSTDATTTDTGGPSCGVRRAIELDTGLLSASTSLPGYPALVVVQDLALATEAPDGADLWFTDEADVVLPHEIDAFDASTGVLQAWVRLPEWEPGMPLAIVLHTGASAPAYAPTMVWADNFAGVWHFGDELGDGRGEIVRDSTAGANHGFVLGGMNADQITDGVIGRAFVFDGVDDEIDVDAAFVGELGSFTVSWWVRIDGDDTTHHPFFQSLNGTLYPRCRRLFAKSGGNVFCQVGMAAETLTVGAEETALPDGTTRHFALRYDAELGELRLFASGDEVDLQTALAPGALLTGDDQLGLGRIDEFGSLLGMLDEFRISQRALEPEWIAADVRTQGTPANLLLAVGAPEPVVCP